MAQPTPTDFRTPTPGAVLASVVRWGAALSYASDRNTEARRLARGFGFVWADHEDGLFPGRDHLTIGAVAASELAPALDAGEAWSTALERVRAEDPESPWTLTYLLHAPNTSAMTGQGLKNKPGSSAKPWDLPASVAFWDPNSNPPLNLSWWKVWRFEHEPAAVLGAVRQLEDDARKLLSSEAEPAAVRELREQVAAAGSPATLEDARAAYARGRGLSDTEAQQLRKPPTMARPFTRSDSITRAIVGSLAPSATITTYAGDAPTKPPGEMSFFAKEAETLTGAGVGAVLGGVLGRVLSGSWTGAAIGAGVGAVAVGGVTYAIAGGDA